MHFLSHSLSLPLSPSLSLSLSLSPSLSLPLSPSLTQTRTHTPTVAHTHTYTWTHTHTRARAHVHTVCHRQTIYTIQEIFSPHCREIDSCSGKREHVWRLDARRTCSIIIALWQLQHDENRSWTWPRLWAKPGPQRRARDCGSQPEKTPETSRPSTMLSSLLGLRPRHRWELGVWTWE